MINQVMRETKETKVLTCDMCGTAGTPATEKEAANEVWNWGNPYDTARFVMSAKRLSTIQGDELH